MRENKGFCSFTFDSAHVKYGVWNWPESLGSHEECCKVFLGKTIRHHLGIHDTTRKYYILFLVLARIPFKIWKISSFFSMSSCSSCLCSFIFTGPARVCDVTMSHTWIYSWCETERPYFLTFSFIFARFCRFACFGRFSGFVSLVSVVSFRSFRSFRWFRFVVSGFSTCPN